MKSEVSATREWRRRGGKKMHFLLEEVKNERGMRSKKKKLKQEEMIEELRGTE